MDTLLDRRLPADLVDEIRRAISGFPAETSFVATGSLVEGLGNPNSDIDLYAIYDERAAGSTSVGLRGMRYVDCEHMTTRSLSALADRITTPGWPAVLDLAEKEISRYYRTAIGIPVAVASTAAAEVLDRFDRATACAVYADWSLVRLIEHVARAACEQASGSTHAAALLIREAVLWRAAWLLAAEGEGYPSLKWTADKAARRYSHGSPEFHRLLEGHLRPAGSPTHRLQELRATIDMPPDLGLVLASRSCHLAHGARLVESGGDSYLMRSGSLARVTGIVSMVCRDLAADIPWHDAIARVAESLGLSEQEVGTATWFAMAALRSAGFVDEDAREHQEAEK